MNLEIKFDEMARDIALRALDKYTYEGKTLREWIDLLKVYEEKKEAPTIDAVPVVRCKDCANYKKRHVLTADGEEKSYEEMPPEAFGGLDDIYVTMEYGINVGGKCMLDEGRGYPVDKSVFRSPNDYCSYGVRMDGDPHDDSGQ